MLRGAVAAVFAAVVMYVWGFSKILSPDVGEACAARGETWDAWEYHASLFPLSRTCNARFDLAPPYVNPTIWALLALAVVLTVLAALTRLRRGKA
ncbi:hypothetical protein ACSHWB_13480 [Lentzea sp. HUAS TT2]|uniref:hypothetical protein n=1 Tax=Lentzea sp. HUAS TT2 TaxID=3447454 RepID=UPI003F6F5106